MREVARAYGIDCQDWAEPSDRSEKPPLRATAGVSREADYTVSMRDGIPLCRLCSSASALAAQEERPVPKDSARISIPGCSKGSAFVVTESPEGECTSVEVKAGRRFRLTSKKDL